MDNEIKSLEDALKNNHCGFIDCVGDVYAVSEETINDVLEILYKQEPKSVNDYESGGVYKFVGLKRGTCPSCRHEVVGGNSTKFCWNCGQAVKWE